MSKLQEMLSEIPLIAILVKIKKVPSIHFDRRKALLDKHLVIVPNQTDTGLQLLASGFGNSLVDAQLDLPPQYLEILGYTQVLRKPQLEVDPEFQSFELRYLPPSRLNVTTAICKDIDFHSTTTVYLNLA